MKRSWATKVIMKTPAMIWTNGLHDGAIYRMTDVITVHMILHT